MVRSNTSQHGTKDEGPPFYENPRLDQLSAKTRAPRWSIGGRWKGLNAAQTPGPGAYSPGQKGYSPPSWSMFGRLGDKSTSFAPGPGAYSPDGKVRKQIAVSLQSRHYMPDAGAATPGPGQYSQNLPFGSPRWSLGGRLNDPSSKQNANTPGPAQYSPEKPRPQRATRLHARVKDIDTRGNLPGPGTYGNPDMNRVRLKSPAYSLGRRPNTASMGMGPGPGNYNPDKKSMSLAYSMTPRREGDLASTRVNPGPGAYSPGDKNSGQSPRKAGMGIGERFFDNDPMKGLPGPGAYQPLPKKGAPAYSMTARRGGGSNSRLQPGPGAYSPKTDYVYASSPRCTLHPRLNMPNGENTPAPNHYYAMRPNTAPAVTIKGRIEPKQGFVSPGPNVYDVVGREHTVKPKSPAYSLGRRIGYQGAKGQQPGPGQYETAFTFVRNHDQYM